MSPQYLRYWWTGVVPLKVSFTAGSFSSTTSGSMSWKIPCSDINLITYVLFQVHILVLSWFTPESAETEACSGWWSQIYNGLEGSLASTRSVHVASFGLYGFMDGPGMYRFCLDPWLHRVCFSSGWEFQSRSFYRVLVYPGPKFNRVFLQRPSQWGLLSLCPNQGLGMCPIAWLVCYSRSVDPSWLSEWPHLSLSQNNFCLSVGPCCSVGIMLVSYWSYFWF